MSGNFTPGDLTQKQLSVSILVEGPFVFSHLTFFPSSREGNTLSYALTWIKYNLDSSPPFKEVTVLELFLNGCKMNSLPLLHQQSFSPVLAVLISLCHGWASLRVAFKCFPELHPVPSYSQVTPWGSFLPLQSTCPLKASCWRRVFTSEQRSQIFDLVA